MRPNLWRGINFSVEFLLHSCLHEKCVFFWTMMYRRKNYPSFMFWTTSTSQNDPKYARKWKSAHSLPLNRNMSLLKDQRTHCRRAIFSVNQLFWLKTFHSKSVLKYIKYIILIKVAQHFILFVILFALSLSLSIANKKTRRRW